MVENFTPISGLVGGLLSDTVTLEAELVFRGSCEMVRGAV
jgi:hypothetical protein